MLTGESPVMAYSFCRLNCVDHSVNILVQIVINKDHLFGDPQYS